MADKVWSQEFRTWVTPDEAAPQGAPQGATKDDVKQLQRERSAPWIALHRDTELKDKARDEGRQDEVDTPTEVHRGRLVRESL